MRPRERNGTRYLGMSPRGGIAEPPWTALQRNRRGLSMRLGAGFAASQRPDSKVGPGRHRLLIEISPGLEAVASIDLYRRPVTMYASVGFIIMCRGRASLWERPNTFPR